MILYVKCHLNDVRAGAGVWCLFECDVYFGMCV